MNFNRAGQLKKLDFFTLYLLYLKKNNKNQVIKNIFLQQLYWYNILKFSYLINFLQ